VDSGSTFYFTVPVQPVREIEPIKVLFSQKDAIERKIKEEFNSILGPLGIGEFDELKTKNALGKEDLCCYVDSLTRQHILTPGQGHRFKNGIRRIFGEEFRNVKMRRVV
jgi:hypothetical protein